MKNEREYEYSIADETEREQAIRLHHERYEEIGFFRKNEPDPYEKNSMYFIAKDKLTGGVTGVTRLIRSRLEELPTMQHFAINDLERLKLSRLSRDQYAEVSAFTKVPQHDVGVGLIRSIFQYSLQNDINYWICCIDERAYNYFQRMFISPFKIIGEPKVYLGSLTIPCVMNLHESLETARVKRRALYDQFAGGLPLQPPVSAAGN